MLTGMLDRIGRAVRVLTAAAADRGPFDPDRLDRRDPQLLADLLPTVDLINRRYLRLEVEGLEHLAAGPRLYAGNHNGGIIGPDLACTMGTLLGTLGPHTPIYGLAHDFAMRQMLPFGRMIQRLGAVRAAPANARRILERGGQALVYPGGDLDAYRRFADRNRIIFGRRTGFVRVAADTGAPIVPIVAQGAHRSAIILSDGARLAAHMRLPRWGRLSRFPIALALPWGLALGPWTPYLPLPLPIRLRILPPIPVAPGDDPHEVREHVRERMQAALHTMVRRR